ncbi:TPA: hypothetical protein ACPVZG_000314 [Vibrio parahaemolyticus]
MSNKHFLVEYQSQCSFDEYNSDVHRETLIISAPSKTSALHWLHAAKTTKNHLRTSPRGWRFKWDFNNLIEDATDVYIRVDRFDLIEEVDVPHLTKYLPTEIYDRNVMISYGNYAEVFDCESVEAGGFGFTVESMQKSIEKTLKRATVYEGIIKTRVSFKKFSDKLHAVRLDLQLHTGESYYVQADIKGQLEKPEAYPNCPLERFNYSVNISPPFPVGESPNPNSDLPVFKIIRGAFDKVSTDHLIAMKMLSDYENIK